MKKIIDHALELEQVDQIAVEQMKEKLRIDLKAILYDNFLPYLNDLNLKNWEYSIGYNTDNSSVKGSGHITVEEVDIPFTVMVNFNRIEFKFSTVQFYGMTNYYLVDKNSFENFVSKLFLAITRRAIDQKHDYMTLINHDLEKYANYIDVVDRVNKCSLFSRTFKDDFNNKYSRKAQLQKAEIEEKEAIRKANEIRLLSLKEEYDQVYKEQHKVYSEWITSLEKTFFEPFFIYEVLYTPKNLVLPIDEEGETDWSSLYLKREVTSCKPDKDGWFILVGSGEKIKILSEIISFIQRHVKVPDSRYCKLVSIPGRICGFGYKNSIYVNSEKVNSVTDFLKTAQIPKVQTFDEFMTEKGYKRDGSGILST